MSLKDEISESMRVSLVDATEQLKAVGPRDMDAIEMFGDVLLPLLTAQRDAILRLTGEVDELRAKLG